MITDNDKHVIKKLSKDILQRHSIEYVADHLMVINKMSYDERIRPDDEVIVHFALTNIETKKDLDSHYWDFDLDIGAAAFQKGQPFDICDREKMIDFVTIRMRDKIEETNEKFPDYFLRPTVIY